MRPARSLSTLIRLLGDVDLAEEALDDAFSAALQQHPRDGTPDNPFAWHACLPSKATFYRRHAGHAQWGAAAVSNAVVGAFQLALG